MRFVLILQLVAFVSSFLNNRLVLKKTYSFPVLTSSKSIMSSSAVSTISKKYLVLDFEGTCNDDDSKTRLQQCLEHEIIEFPCVVIDGESFEELDVFHEYIKPVENEQLSDFCTRLTGITQEMVKDKDDLSQVLDRFYAWLDRTGLTDQLIDGSAQFITHGEWDLGDQFRIECQRKQLKYPPYMQSFVDIKIPFLEAYSHQRTSIAGMMGHLQIKPSGRLHSGIDDSRNIARVLVELLKLGANLVTTHSCVLSSNNDIASSSSSISETIRYGKLIWLRKAPKPHPNDYECVECQADCFGRSLNCYRCGAHKPMNSFQSNMKNGEDYGNKFPSGLHQQVRPGDWVCPLCHVNNFASRSECFKCYILKPVGTNNIETRNSFNTHSLPGDWECPSCHINVFAKRNECFRCQTPKSVAIPPASSPFPPSSSLAETGRSSPVINTRYSHGDWICPLCSTNVFGSRDRCLNCQTLKPASILSHVKAVQEKGRKEVGDWECPTCQLNVFKSRSSCVRCFTPKPINANS